MYILKNSKNTFMYQKSIDIASLVDVYKIIEAVKFDDGKYDTVVIF
jgi:hypothetical protein